MQQYSLNFAEISLTVVLCFAGHQTLTADKYGKESVRGTE